MEKLHKQRKYFRCHTFQFYHNNRIYSKLHTESMLTERVYELLLLLLFMQQFRWFG